MLARDSRNWVASGSAVYLRTSAVQSLAAGSADAAFVTWMYPSNAASAARARSCCSGVSSAGQGSVAAAVVTVGAVGDDDDAVLERAALDVVVVFVLAEV